MLVTSLERKTLSAFLIEVRKLVSLDSLPNDVRFAIEVDPITMY